MRHATRLAIGPAGFRIGSDWRAPIAQLEDLYRDYPRPDIPDFNVHLFAARPWRKFLRPAVHIGGDYSIPDAAPLPLAQGLLAAEMGMNLQMALAQRRFLLLHASAVERDGRAVLMTGISGAILKYGYGFMDNRRRAMDKCRDSQTAHTLIHSSAGWPVTHKLHSHCCDDHDK